ncbi:hypothetical protein AB0B45_42990 [Nonomuraea sp. NPDC049152]|uniref:hypothetical protein n=1 Tax=Nonomuraea sp. NPDC049152 TaxID=3154350 RepID=UPI0033EDEFEC
MRRALAVLVAVVLAVLLATTPPTPVSAVTARHVRLNVITSTNDSDHAARVFELEVRGR